MEEQLRKNPFFLNDRQIAWVQQTLQSMTVKEKIHQLFCLVTYSDEEEYCKYLSQTVCPGGVMGRVMSPERCVNAVSLLQSNSKIPLLIAANLEAGGNGVVSGGTAVCRPMQAAATGDEEFARRLGEVCGVQGRAAGVNWSFAPIVDIDYNWRNPITNFRTFGSNVETVAKMGEAYVKEIQRHGVAACIKHFPGDGCDERDQHVCVSVNDLSCEEWDRTYGTVYSRCIQAGAMSVMVGHIMQPAYARRFEPDLTDGEMLPASVSRSLVTGLLREKLGFNGVIVTDSTAMAGISLMMPRERMIPMTIAAGCDMFLFTKNLEEDISFMEKGYEDGVLTEARLNEAVLRILAMKAALGLPEQQSQNTICPDVETLKRVIQEPTYKQWEKECAKRSITLVKEEKGVFPITPERFRRILFCPLDKNGNGADEKTANGKLMKAFEKAGFDVTLFEAQNVTEGNMTSVNELTAHYDMIVYSAMVRARYQPVARIDWSSPQGANIPTLCHTIPTVFISLESPYHLVDVPQIRTYINCYNGTQTVIDALMDKLMGKSPFTGISPVDPFCGKWDAAVSFGPKIDFEKYNPKGEK